ncbi:glycosyltransferase family 2 protein [Clostridium perfringens]
MKDYCKIPKVSIIIPIYNVEKYLKRCIESIRNQTLKDIEIILVDDESPDRCPEICDYYKKIDKRIKVIHKKNGGLGLARNSGLNIACGKYVAFIDSDDFLELDMFEILYNKAYFENADVVISGGFIRELKSGKVELQQEVDFEEIFENKENTKIIPLKMMGALANYHKDYELEMSACKGIYRRKLIEDKRIRFHSERELISEDLVFHFDLFQYTNRVVLIPQSFYHYCENEGSLTKKYDDSRFFRNIEFYDFMINKLKEEKYPMKSIEYADRMLLARARVAIVQISNHFSLNIKCKNEILKICTNSKLESIMSRFDIQYLPIKQKIFVKLMKNKCWILLYAISRLNTLIK